MVCLKIKERQTVIAVVGFNAILIIVVDVLYGVNLIGSWKRLDDLRMNAPEHAPCNFDVFLDHFNFNLIYNACFFALYCVVDIAKAVLLWVVLSRKEHSEFWASLQVFSVFVLVGHWMFSFFLTPSLHPVSVTFGVFTILWNILLMCGVLWHNWESWIFKPETPPPAATNECSESGTKSHDQRSFHLDNVPANVKLQGMRIRSDEDKLEDENEQRAIVEGINGASVAEGDSEILLTDPHQKENVRIDNSIEEVAMPGKQYQQNNNAVAPDFSTAKPTGSDQGTWRRYSSLPDVSVFETYNEFEMLSYRNEVHCETSRDDGVDENVATAADVSRNDGPMCSEDREANMGGTFFSSVMAFFH